jgi:hypothetical protein
MTHSRWPALLALALAGHLAAPLSAADLHPEKDAAKLPVVSSSTCWLT